jgi:hypothetical protein
MLQIEIDVNLAALEWQFSHVVFADCPDNGDAHLDSRLLPRGGRFV